MGIGCHRGLAHYGDYGVSPLFKSRTSGGGGGAAIAKAFKWVQIKRKIDVDITVDSVTHPIHTVADAALDITGSAEVGDVLEAEIRFSGAINPGFASELVTMVAGAPVNGFSSGAAYAAGSSLAVRFMNEDAQTRPNYKIVKAYTVQAGDIEDGEVTLRYLIGTNNATDSVIDGTRGWPGSQEAPLTVVVKNLGGVS